MHKWTFFILISFITLTAFSQRDSLPFQPMYSLGAHYGVSWNKVNFAPPIDQNNFSGSRMGLTFRYVSDPHLGIQLELSYDQRGWTEQVDTFGNTYSRTIDNIELTALSHITIGRRAFKPLILLGTFIGYPIGDKEDIPAVLDVSTKDYYGTPLPSRLQYGLAGGVGFDYRIGKMNLQINGRYRSALGNIFPSGTDGLTFSQSRGFVVQGSLLFEL